MAWTDPEPAGPCHLQANVYFPGPDLLSPKAQVAIPQRSASQMTPPEGTDPRKGTDAAAGYDKDGPTLPGASDKTGDIRAGQATRRAGDHEIASLEQGSHHAREAGSRIGHGDEPI